MKTLVLIDGHAILHRAYHAFPKTLTNRHGQLVNAVYGFTRMLLKVIEDLKPCYLLVTFDRPEPTFRHQEFLGYQAQRPSSDQEMKDQLIVIKEILKTFNIPMFEKTGYEADDLIGTLTTQAANKKKEIESIIVTGDRDIFQLINKTTLVYAPIKGFSQVQTFNRKKAKKAIGVWPEQIVDYKALVGDASDNYPGVPGVGPKTAVSLLRSFESLKKVYKNLGKIRESVRKKLIEGEESALLSQKLAQIVTDIPIKLNLKKCLLHDYDQEKVLKLFKKLGFKSLMNKLPGMEKSSKGRSSSGRKKASEQMRLV